MTWAAEVRALPMAADHAPTGRSPIVAMRAAMVAAMGYLVVALAWATWGAGLPGGRWAAVHLFTLGVVSNLVVALVHHFSQTLMHAPDQDRSTRLVVVNVGAVMVLVGLPTAQRWLVGLGATVLTVAVLWLYLDIRRMRRSSLTGRWAFVVRTYERACSAFIHGALLGGLMGAGVLSGAWYGAARVAHLHINILGWGGLTLLGTIVFFGPTVMRTPLEPDADGIAARWLRRGATGLSVAALAMLATGLDGTSALVARGLAAGGLAVYALGVAAVCLPVLRSGQRAGARHAAARMMQATCIWFMVLAAADAVVVASDQLRLLDALGVAMLVGVLGQSIVASLAHLVPMVFATGASGVPGAVERLSRWSQASVVVLNGGLVLVTLAAVVRGSQLAGVARLGWVMVLAAVVAQLGLLAVTAVGVRRPSRAPG